MRVRVVCTNVRTPVARFTLFRVYCVYSEFRSAYVIDDTGQRRHIMRAPLQDAVYSTLLHAAQFVKVEVEVEVEVEE
jgi:hypothetical protein